MTLFRLGCAALGVCIATAVQADPALDTFAREVSRAEGVRAVKTLTHSYAQFAQYGLWNDVGALFAADAIFTFDGLVKEAQTARGPAAIAAFLRARYGGGHEGLRAAGLSSMFIDNPVVNLSADGSSAKARWNALIFHGHDGMAQIEGGILDNDYVLDRGVWKIAAVRYYPQFDGPYEVGWINWGGGDLPIVPYRFDVDTNGIPIPPATGPAPRTQATLAALQRRVDALNDEDRIRSLQAAYGFYEDRKMWDDVVDLFARDGLVEIGGVGTGAGVWRGPDGVRRWLETMGPAGLTHGQLNDRVQFDVTVTISPGGNEAWARGIELGMLGEADQEKGWWEVATFRNRFVRENGVWKLREMRRFPLMKTDIFAGWGKSRLVDGRAMPAFLGTHPVTGRPVQPAGDARVVATSALTGAIAPGTPASITLDEAKRRLARSTAWDGITNVSSAYGYYLDDSMPAGFGGIMAKNGFKMSPFAGYYVTRERVLKARVGGDPPTTRAGISYHWLVQPVVLISDDGRSAVGRFRLFQPRTGKTVGKAGDFFGASFWGGMYHDQYVLEDGIWRIWELTLDEPYINPVAWKDGVWAKSKDPLPPPPGTPPRVFRGGNFPPDIPLTALGRREEHFRGGTGQTLEWPSILPMWFQYTNPVSGRMPEFYQGPCVPCAVRPELRLEANGYQKPPDAPEANRTSPSPTSAVTRQQGRPVPRTPWGEPDLQGTYSNRTITPLERPVEFGTRAFFSAEEVAALEKQAQAQTGDESRAKGTQGDVARAYNDFWWDRGTKATSLRTSLVIDPPDGRIPPETDAARRRAANEGTRPAFRSAGASVARGTDSWLDRSTFERCITRGMPGAMLPTAYNNNYRITQSPGYVAIEIEMLGGTRLIPTDGRRHVSQQIRQWMGDSVGRWDGETLVVETTNFTDKVLYRNAAEGLHLVERFTRVGPEEIDYRVTITDPTTFTRPWTIAVPFVVTGEDMFEYACHEGNYGMVGILSGAREEEAAAANKK
jgi:hypothetical protein